MSAWIVLSVFIGGALGIFAVAGSVSPNGYTRGCAAAVLIVSAVHRVAVYLQAAFRRFKKVFENASPVLLKACTAGSFCIPGSMAVYQNRAPAAALIRIVHTVFH